MMLKVSREFSGNACIACRNKHSSIVTLKNLTRNKYDEYVKFEILIYFCLSRIFKNKLIKTITLFFYYFYVLIIFRSFNCHVISRN